MQDLTVRHWAPSDHAPLDFTDRIPILACHLEALQRRGPHADIWWRFGAHQWQTLADALARTEYRARVQARLDAEEQAAHEAREKRLEATRCPGCNRRSDEIPRGRPSDGTELCGDCQTKTWREAQEKKQQAVRDAHARRWPCYTCKGPLGGRPGSDMERTTEAPPDALECPSCDAARVGRLPIILPMPTAREMRRARKEKPDDPWWEMRLRHAREHPGRPRG
ncbi:hypothetical protein AB0442_36435 [Kitasatospora sp. NPDC085895]|uniref:hypothetical protein n=1 Tax=Kitasatospora sp. NPDC085895 TaxID=3155057 RepID=UPI00344B55A1